MIKSELVHRVASTNTHLYESDVAKVIGAIFDEITNEMVRGNRVELRGFGVFSTKVRQARTGRNPRTGTTVAVPHKVVPSFRAGKEMYRRLNTGPDKAAGSEYPLRLDEMLIFKLDDLARQVLFP
jgi:integration host factor subunit beta